VAKETHQSSAKCHEELEKQENPEELASHGSEEIHNKVARHRNQETQIKLAHQPAQATHGVKVRHTSEETHNTIASQ